MQLPLDIFRIRLQWFQGSYKPRKLPVIIGNHSVIIENHSACDNRKSQATWQLTQDWTSYFSELQQLAQNVCNQMMINTCVFISFRSHDFSHLKIVTQWFCSTGIEDFAWEEETNVSVVFITSEKPVRTSHDHLPAECVSRRYTVANLCKALQHCLWAWEWFGILQMPSLAQVRMQTCML